MPPPLDAVLLDAGFTLLQPIGSVAEHYHGHAAALGFHPERSAFEARLAAVWRRGGALRADPESLESSDQLERAGWERFTRAVAAPWPDLSAGHGAWLARLFTHFDDPANWELIEGVREGLSALRDAGLRLMVVSNWHTQLHPILAAHGLTPFFEAVLTSAEHGQRKPAPSIFEAALRALDLPAASVAHVGDSPEDDGAGARAAGIRPLLLLPADPGDGTPWAATWPDLTRRLLAGL